MSEIRVRFAPSPTGDLHIGGARTAYFNWLFARHHKGSFILRIEDTDLKRSTGEAVEVIVEGLRWLGIDWDEGPGKDGDCGPYFQSRRLDIYKEFADKLIDKGLAYYDKSVSDGEETQAVKFAVPHRREITVKDIIKKKVSFSCREMKDLVLIKSDGTPAYNFAAVVDDALMEITHVIRGEDHLSNTPKQILIYEALGFDLPEFAHIPMILGPDRSKLSKRHGAAAVTEFKEEGFLPEAVCNYLALLGWSLNESEQLFNKNQAVKKFSLEDVSSSPAVFDCDKLEWLNGKYIRKKDPQIIKELCLKYLIKNGYLPPDPVQHEVQRAEQIIEELITRIKYIKELDDLASFFFKKPEDYTEEAREILNQDYVNPALKELVSVLENIESFEVGNIEDALRSLAERLDLSAGELIHPTRAALTGKTVSPGIFMVIKLIGREECIDRINKTLKELDSG